MVLVNLSLNIEEMEKKYHKALIIGKFQPLHKGHMALIQFASEHAEEVVVCLTAHKGEVVPMSLRKKWLDEAYQDNPNVTIKDIAYDANTLTDSSESNISASHAWADFLKSYFGDSFRDFDVIVGSERYVQYMSDYLGLDNLVYDEERTTLPISATMIKNDLFRYWDYLAPAVKRTYVKHVCICGSESTGKTTTAQLLEKDFNYVTMIPEIGRCLVGKSELCLQQTLLTIYKIHNELLHAVIADPPTPIIVWDTDNITTYSYKKFLFPKDNTVFADIPKADNYFFFESNITFVDDGTRLAKQEALELRTHHLSVYKECGVVPELVTNDNRYEIVKSCILEYVEGLKKTFLMG